MEEEIKKLEKNSNLYRNLWGNIPGASFAVVATVIAIILLVGTLLTNANLHTTLVNIFAGALYSIPGYIATIPIQHVIREKLDEIIKETDIKKDIIRNQIKMEQKITDILKQENAENNESTESRVNEIDILKAMKETLEECANSHQGREQRNYEDYYARDGYDYTSDSYDYVCATSVEEQTPLSGKSKKRDRFFRNNL